jgi:hypothetical protein
MRHSEKIAPIAAVVSALSTMLCCLLSGIAAAAGAVGLGIMAEPFRRWLIGLTVALLVVGIDSCIARSAPASGEAGLASLYSFYPRS